MHIRRQGQSIRRLALLALLVLSPWSPARAASVTVEITGVEGPVLENVRAYLGIARQDFVEDGETVDPAMIRRLHARAPPEIRNALQPYGYYEPSIDARLQADDEGNWTAHYRIRPGPPVRLVEVDVRVEGDGADDPRFVELLDGIGLRESERLEHRAYESAKSRLLEMASDRGYLEARWIDNVLRIDPDRREARAILVLDSGPRYSFGRIEFERTVLSEAFLARYLRFSPGEPFDGGKLLELQYALDDSDYFRRVDVRARRNRAADGRIPIDVELEARPKHRYTLGIGFGTDTGPRVSVGRETRYVNDRGHRLAMEARVAEIGSELGARYTIPLSEPWRERLELDTSLGEEDIGDGNSEQFELGGKYVTASKGWQQYVSLRYQRSIDRISGETETRDLVMPGIGIGRSRFDSNIYATRGYRIAFDLSGGTETFGSDVSFLRGVASGSGVLGLWDGGRVIGRLQLGRVRVWDAFEELPLSQRFYAGGDQSVRGFDYQSLGPTNDQGDVIGGRYLAVSSLELEQLIVGNWGAAVFVDHGNAIADADDPLRTAVGVGLRYRSPVGVFRVDVAKATDGDESARLHLGLGVNL